MTIYPKIRRDLDAQEDDIVLLPYAGQIAPSVDMVNKHPVLLPIGTDIGRRQLLQGLYDQGINCQTPEIQLDRLRRSKTRGQPTKNQILELTFKKDGFLTVADVVMKTGLPIKGAQQILYRMVDSYRVSMQVKDSGISVYVLTL